MARFMIKASEYKNVCKAVNDRKLAELKKEIIEILKKQDEKEVKKAIDYFNSQELHYTHLEKSFITGKWIEKAGYGIGTVRIWKGKKYKKIAPGKWARVFEKEGRGTNIAIGKLIARVQKIDNVEDLMAFVMQNKQRFVDENGVDLPVLDKLRAAVDERNGNVGSKEKTETKFDSKEVLANLDKYVKTIGGVYGIKKYTEDDDTEKTFARIKDHFDSDSTKTYDDAQGWNQAARQIAEYAKKEGLSTDELIKQSIKNNIKDESIEGTPTFGGKKTEYMERLEEQSKKAEEGKNRQTETKVNGYGEATDREITSLAYKRDVARKERDFNSYFGRGMDKKNNNRGYSKPAKEKEDLESALKEVEDAIDNAGDYDDVEELEKERKQLLKKLGKKPAETSKQTDYYKDISEVLTKDEKRRINEKVEEYSKENEWSIPAADMKKFVKDWQSALKETDKHTKAEKLYEIYSKLEDANWHDENKKLLAGNFEYFNDKYFKNMYGEEPEEKPAEKKSPEKLLKEMGFETMEKVSYNGDKWKVAGVSLDSDGNAVGVSLTPDRQSGNLKSSNVTVEDIGKIKKEKPAEKEESENKTYWIQDSKGNRITSEDAKARIKDQLNQIDSFNELIAERSKADGMKMEVAKRSLEQDNKYLMDRLNPEDRKEIESEAEKHQNRSDAMKGNKNAYKGGLAKDTVKFVNAVKGEPYHDFETDINKFAIYSDDLGKQTGLVITQDIADIIDSHNEPSILDWKDAVAEEIHNKYPKIEASYIKLGLGGIRPGYRNGKKESIKVIPSKEEISSNKEKVAKRPSGKIATSNPDKLKPISSHEKVADGKVKMPYSKELSEEVKQLVGALDNKKKHSRPREFFTKVYYDNGNLVASDGYSLKIIKVGELDGINNGSYVDIDNSKDGITITENKEFTKDYRFANYKRVIPDGNKEKVVLDNKALISKIKELKKDGSISNKDSFVTFDVNGNDLMLDGVKVGDVSAANFEGDNSDFFNMDANILSQYLSGDTTELITSTDTEKPMYIGNDSAVSIIMPQIKYERKYDSNGTETTEIRRKNYESLREDKKLGDEAKANKKAAQKLANKDYVDGIIDRYKRSVPANFEEKSIEKLKEWTTEQLQRMYKVANADIDSLMEKKDFNSNTFSGYSNKHYDMSPERLIGQHYAMKDHPAIVKELERLLEERGVKIEKSLFGDFITDMLVDEVIEDEEEDEENESEYNDYSAEQPELFNSTEFLVREALNRRYNCM